MLNVREIGLVVLVELLVFFIVFCVCCNNIFYIYLLKTFKYMIKYIMLMISYEFEKFMKIMFCILDEMPLVFKNLNMAHFDYSFF